QLKNSEIIDAVIKLNACYKNIKNKKNYIFLQGRSFVLDGGVLMGDPGLCLISLFGFITLFPVISLQ
ncbi:MAG: hypothetical protein ACUZ8E_00405, partial [Candidatus Anammoxibacter sp.]